MNTYRSLTARDIMVHKVIALRHQMDAIDAIKVMLKYRISGAPVVDLQGRYLGVFSEKSSLSVLLGMEYDYNPTTEIRNYIDADARVVYEDTDLLSIVNIFLTEPYRRLPVLREPDELVGLVCRRDVLKAFHSGIVNRQNQNNNSDSGSLYLSSVTERQNNPIAN